MTKYRNDRQIPHDPSEQMAVNDQLREFIEEVAEAGTNLRILRTQEGWTYQQLAEKIGVDENHLIEMEKGEQPIPTNVAKKLATLFQVGERVFLL